jgi:mRNA interferase HicA
MSSSSVCESWQRSADSIFQLDAARGKGSHVTLYLGDKLTIVRNPKDELKTGTFHAMLKQLGIEAEEL